mmetsp:Transcript_441/g.1478  ORF Transcript_441/g.1478 Transcript_441/m.1478 type:complete len:259 (-) Transcript_441:30-806(-)
MATQLWCPKRVAPGRRWQASGTWHTRKASAWLRIKVVSACGCATSCPCTHQNDAGNRYFHRKAYKVTIWASKVPSMSETIYFKMQDSAGQDVGLSGYQMPMHTSGMALFWKIRDFQAVQKSRRAQRETAKGFRAVVAAEGEPASSGAGAAAALAKAAPAAAALGKAPPAKKAKHDPVPKVLDVMNVMMCLPPRARLYEDPIEQRVRLHMTVFDARRTSGGSIGLQALPMLLARLVRTAWQWHKEATGGECPWPEFATK